MIPTSPRSTDVNQTLDSSPISTSPMTWADSSTQADGWSVGTVPRYGRIRRLLLRDGHDDLRLPGEIQEVVEADHRGHQGGLHRILGAECTQTGDAALEARFDALQAITGGPLERNGDEPLFDDVLRDHELVDTIAVEIHRQGGRLDLVELREVALPATGNHQLELGVATAHRGGGAPDLLAVEGDAEPVLLVDHGERPRLLAGDVRERGAHGAERRGHPHRLHDVEVALPHHDLVGLARREEIVGVVPL